MWLLELVLSFLLVHVITSSGPHRNKFDPGRTNVLVLLGDDAGVQMSAYNNAAIKSPNFDKLSERSVVFSHGFTSVSSCSPSRSVVLTGQPQHQNGMYGLHHNPHHFNTFDSVQSLPVMLGDYNIRTGIIGKKHVGPDYVYKFDYEQTEENNNLDQVGRNITCMKNLVHEFLNDNDTRPFFLYIGIHDPHRCDAYGKTGGKGEFCENFGDGRPGNGVIQDWTPTYYSPDDVKVPYYIPETPAARRDIANFYKTLSRMDQGIGLFMKELENAGFMENTMVLYSSDNGIPFPTAKTNLYEAGMMEPFMISSPLNKQNWGKHADALASTMDITPTVLDWFNISTSRTNKVKLTGRSLLDVVVNTSTDHPVVYSSHTMHEVTMYYPMRVIRTHQYRLIHNLNYHAPYPIASDLFGAQTFQDMLNRSANSESLNWFKTLDEYYHRPEFELFDFSTDPMELNNLANRPEYQDILKQLKQQLLDWQIETKDPWYCLPGGDVMNNECYALRNGETFVPAKGNIPHFETVN
ncbi:N-sulphoglucosamine sulphohydrolase [Patella vulgata]|uniref:N-sulphoglucosamine sulphohydrolase n=1 Tax=Patella vulgata TaxID=6465 RepID=UPI0024A83302|nr:N-sulphoglucosamine sulphohydrolase [Patella vulgata]